MKKTTLFILQWTIAGLAGALVILFFTGNLSTQKTIVEFKGINNTIEELEYWVKEQKTPMLGALRSVDTQHSSFPVFQSLLYLQIPQDPILSPSVWSLPEKSE